MSKKILFSILSVFILLFILFSGVLNDKDENKNKDVKLSEVFDNKKTEQLVESCFNLQKNKLKVFKGDITPKDFLSSNHDVKSAINGVYWAADTGEPQGIVYTSKTGNLSSGTGRVTGYLTIKNGVISLKKEIEELKDYDIVIGTYPLLVEQGVVSSQAKEERYNKYLAFRSAIGTKTGEDVCFVVSQGVVAMEMWAELLVERNYKDAINLDGGGSSQLSIKDKGVFGGGNDPSKIIFYVDMNK